MTKNTYYTIYFPAFSCTDDIFLSTSKAKLEQDYAGYLIEEHTENLLNRLRVINPNTPYSEDDFDAFKDYLLTLPSSEVLLLNGCYAKEVNYPHLNIPVRHQNNRTYELGVVAIADNAFDMIQLVNKETLTDEGKQAINRVLHRKNFHQIYWPELSTDKTFMVPVLWQSWGQVPVKATDLEDLKAKLSDSKFLANLPIPYNNGEYVEDSFTVDWDNDLFIP